MKRSVLLGLLCCPLMVSSAWAGESVDALEAKQRQAIVAKLAEALGEIYVFPEVAKKMDDLMQQRLRDGAYDDLSSLPALTTRLTEDLRSVSHDLHLTVRPIPERDFSAENEVDPEEVDRRYRARARAGNYGFKRLERLAGNVGYLDLRGFSPAELGGPTAIAAMNFLATADALIIDLRQNGGGSPSMIQLITSYFFEEPVHLNSFYIRRDSSTQQFWTQAHVEGPRMTETPIFVLTSGRTFSAAEEFSYNLKNLERATIVGETTGGGAHPVDLHRFPELGIEISLPFGRAVNPITGTNWEGTGVEPDIAVPAEQALDVAHRDALEGLLQKATDPDQTFRLGWAHDLLKAKVRPIVLTPAQLESYVGLYGPRRIRLVEGKLSYQREDRPTVDLIPLGDDRFALDGTDNFRIRFERDATHRVVTLMGLYDSGREEPSARTE